MKNSTCVGVLFYDLGIHVPVIINYDIHVYVLGLLYCRSLSSGGYNFYVHRPTCRTVTLFQTRLVSEDRAVNNLATSSFNLFVWWMTNLHISKSTKYYTRQVCLGTIRTSSVYPSTLTHSSESWWTQSGIFGDWDSQKRLLWIVIGELTLKLSRSTKRSRSGDVMIFETLWFQHTFRQGKRHKRFI